MKILSGTIVKGAGRGSKVGFRTANIRIKQKRLRGVYAVIICIGNKKYKGVANIGYAPTFNTKRETKQLEAHIFNFSKNIIGKRISVQLVKKLRAEKKFASVGSLAAQIRKDARDAKKILKNK